MPSAELNLFVEINESNFFFVVGKLDENQNLKIIEKAEIKNDVSDNNELINSSLIKDLIKDAVEKIEEKCNFIFKEIIVIIDNLDHSCFNISGFKKLNGSQVLKENISYILNSLKSSLVQQENHKTILHIFNSKNILDGKRIENLPVGLFGDFYNHELTFFMIKNNDLKNIKQMFSKSKINIKKVFLKNFTEGTQLIDKDKNTETFFKINIDNNSSSVSFFDRSSLRYSEFFKFGSQIIYKDISKICSIDTETIKNLLTNLNFGSKDLNDKEIIEEKHFLTGKFRKIRKKLIYDISNARIEEICNIVLNKNINLRYLKKKGAKIYISIKDRNIFENFKNCFEDFLNIENSYNLEFFKKFNVEESVKNASNLSIFGWKKEAIPVTQTKKSLITRIFNSLFE